MDKPILRVNHAIESHPASIGIVIDELRHPVIVRGDSPDIGPCLEVTRSLDRADLSAICEDVERGLSMGYGHLLRDHGMAGHKPGIFVMFDAVGAIVVPRRVLSLRELRARVL